MPVKWCKKCDNIGELYIVDLDTGETKGFPCDACDGKGYTEEKDQPKTGGDDSAPCPKCGKPMGTHGCHAEGTCCNCADRDSTCPTNGSVH